MSGKRAQRRGTARSVTAGAALALVLVAPVEANWLARGSAVLGVGHSLKRNLGEGIDLMGEALDAAMHGDAERVREIGEEIEALPGRLIRDTFPVFKLGAGVKDAAVSAGEKLKSAAGRIPRLRSKALGRMEASKERLQSVTLKVRRYYGDADEGGADPRMALAVDEEERALFGADTEIPDEPALAAVTAVGATGASEALGWDDVAGSEGEDQAVEAAAKGSDPWAADEGGTRSSGWDEEPASGGMQVARAEVEEAPAEEIIEADGDDYTGALNALLSDAAADGGESSAGGKAVAGEAAANVTQSAGTRSDAVEKPKWPPGKKFRDCAECPEMVVVPAGSFMMGSPPGEEGRSDAEGPVHQVIIAKPFAVGIYEVTRGQFATFMHAAGHGELIYNVTSCWNHYDRFGWPNQDNQPAGCVNWHDAQAYLLWLSKKTGRKYRLLSESEWEYAARAGTSTSRHWGDSVSSTCKYANVMDRLFKKGNRKVHDCMDGYTYTSPVGSHLPNEYGLYDMMGNVLEYTEDCAHVDYNGAPLDGSAWNQDGNCNASPLRGGDATEFGTPGSVRSAARLLGFSRRYRENSFGFRVAATLD